MANAAPRSLYVHVPFCAHRCGYCDFVTTSASPELHQRYVRALGDEYAARGFDESSSFDTVFVGGGTPTLLEPAARESLLEWISGLVAADAEVTIECNPETVTDELARSLAAGGVTRVSLGAQSFQQQHLTTLERRATPDDVCSAVDVLRSAGIPRLSLDLIWAIPGQTEEDLAADLEEVVALGTGHLSAYELEFKPGTRMQRAYGSAEEAVGDAADAMYDLLVDTLGAAGYEWYETANFARRGDYCRHNLAYWTQVDHIGLGVGAFGTVGEERRNNLPNIVRYLDAAEGGTDVPARIEHLDGATRQRERIMLALRLARPCRITYPEVVAVVDVDGVAEAERLGLLVTSGGAHELELVLTRRGRMLLNATLGLVLR